MRASMPSVLRSARTMRSHSPSSSKKPSHYLTVSSHLSPPSMQKRMVRRLYIGTHQSERASMRKRERLRNSRLTRKPSLVRFSLTWTHLGSTMRSRRSLILSSTLTLRTSRVIRVRSATLRKRPNGRLRTLSSASRETGSIFTIIGPEVRLRNYLGYLTRESKLRSSLEIPVFVESSPGVTLSPWRISVLDCHSRRKR